MILIFLWLWIQIPFSLNDLCEAWNRIYHQVQYGTVDRKLAGRALRELTRQIHDLAEIPKDSVFYFPVEGYGLADVGRDGKGFIPRRYNFLHGNAHRGHPAHDIFIKDRNSDGLDDDTGKPVRVLAMDGGIVLSLKTDWSHGDSLRGGNFILIYNPHRRRYYYYAHNDSIYASVGAVVKAGDPIATIGRTGRSAYRKDSPTHLHLMVLQLSDQKYEPYDFYPELKKSKLTRKRRE